MSIQEPHTSHQPEFHDVVIVGAGFSGISAARELLNTGRHDFLILERAAQIGGVWRENRYPNAACDVPAHLYSLSFALNPNWSSNFAPWWEIQSYMEDVVDGLGVRDRIRYGTELVAARWDEEAAVWHLILADATRLDCRSLISAVGALSRPSIPDLPGMEEFAGEIFHTAEWHEGIALAGKRVVVVGAGASAVQVVPYVVDHAAATLAVVRTAPYVMPKPEEFYGDFEKAFFASHPEELLARRDKEYTGFNVSTRAQAVMDEDFLRAREADWRVHLEASVSDPALREILTPDYRWGCRRPVVSNVFYPALADARTDVWDVGIAAFTPEGVVGADGREWAADVVVLATGFRGTELFEGVEYLGRDGRSLRETWGSEPEAYKGTLVEGFPNLYLTTGPNTQASGSIIGIIEAQTRMIAALMDLCEHRGATGLTVTAEAQARYNSWLVEEMAGTVWEAGGCSSWYRAGGTGKVVTKFPGALDDFERITQDIALSDLELSTAIGAARETSERVGA